MTTEPTTVTSDATFSVSAELGDVLARTSDALVTATAPIEVGSHLLVRHPADWKITEFDRHALADRPAWIADVRSHSSVASFTAWIDRFSDEATTVWLAASTLQLGASAGVAEVIFDDDHPDYDPARRVHRAKLVLNPTDAAARWAKAFDAPLSQQQLVDLAIDGIAEIASPPGAVLHDLVRDLTATRSSTARSVVASSGGYSVQFDENVQLAAGVSGNTVELPTKVSLVIRPWRGFDYAFSLEVRLRPVVKDNGSVTVTLIPIGLADALADAGRHLGHVIGEATGLTPFEK